MIYGPSKLYAIIVVTIVLNYCVICYLSIHWIVSEHLSLRNKNSGYNFQVYWFVFSTFAVHMNTLCWYNIERLLRYVILTLPCYAFMYFFLVLFDMIIGSANKILTGLTQMTYWVIDRQNANCYNPIMPFMFYPLQRIFSCYAKKLWKFETNFLVN